MEVWKMARATAAAKEKVIEHFLSIPILTLETGSFFIEGTAPLVTNPFPLKQQEEIKAKENTPESEKPKKKVYAQRFPYEDFSNALYWITPKPLIKAEDDWNNALNDNPKFGYHVGGLKQSALSAALRRKLIPNNVEGRMYFNIIGAVSDRVYGNPVLEILTGMPPIMREDCLSTFNSGASMRYRPMFEKWKIEVVVQFDPAIINIENIMYWFTLGGAFVGIGENRPEKGGTWGSYVIAGK
jgi:hypothetical protein